MYDKKYRAISREFSASPSVKLPPTKTQPGLLYWVLLFSYIFIHSLRISNSVFWLYHPMPHLKAVIKGKLRQNFFYLSVKNVTSQSHHILSYSPTFQSSVPNTAVLISRFYLGIHHQCSNVSYIWSFSALIPDGHRNTLSKRQQYSMTSDISSGPSYTVYLCATSLFAPNPEYAIFIL